MKFIKQTVTIYFLLAISVITAEVKLPAIISDNMVIQQNTKVPIWGWANEGEQIKIKASWDENTQTITADANGKWKVTLKSPEAGGSYKIEIQGENKIIIKDVLAGEVWLASGQSNMARAVKRSDNPEEEISAANYPDIRLFHIERTYSGEPKADCNGKWVKCTPETVTDFSAVAYFFGRELHKKLNVPVGLISSNYGGSPIEAWLDRTTLDTNPDLSNKYQMWVKWEQEYPEAEKQYDENYEEQLKTRKLQEPVNKEPLDSILVDMTKKSHRRPAFLYNAMISPIIPYAIKGVIWYQGENNVSNPIQYRELFPLLISDWRKKWEMGDFPFYYVQIAPWRYKKDFEKASLLREAQMMTMSVPNTGMVVTVDIGNVGDIHPTNKQDVGKRLSLWALAKTYGFNDVVYSGPIYKTMKIEDNKIRIFFDHIGSGLMKKGETLTHFEIACTDKQYREAVAVIEDSTVVVSNTSISEPVAVRYSWSIISIPNLYNKEGLPAAPFRTD